MYGVEEISPTFLTPAGRFTHLSTRTVDGLCATMWMDRVYTDYEGAQSNCLRIRRGKNRCVKGLEREP